MKNLSTLTILLALGSMFLLAGIITTAVSFANRNNSDSNDEDTSTPASTTTQPTTIAASPSLVPTTMRPTTTTLRPPTGIPITTPSPSTDNNSSTATPKACSICTSGDNLLFPNRTIYREGDETPVTCFELQESASQDGALCTDIEQYRFYCGCASVSIDDVSCGLCGPGNSTPFSDRILEGFAPDFIPQDEYTCGEVERQFTLFADDTTCQENKGVFEDIITLCGCILPPVSDGFLDTPCTGLCLQQNLDELLIPRDSWEAPALAGQAGYGTLNCYELQQLAATGTLEPDQCDAVRYAGVKNCGCTSGIQFCDLCEDGSAVAIEKLSEEVTFNRTCLDWAGLAYFLDSTNDICPAFQRTAGVFCGCDNPIANQDACRICEGTDIVPISNLTIVLDEFDIDCGEIEFTANNPEGEFDCSFAQEFAIQCCENAPSSAPTVT